MQRVPKRHKYDIGLGSNDDLNINKAAQLYNLQPLDKRIEDVYKCYLGGGELPAPFLPENMWNEWLWGFDPSEACNIDCLMNRSHLLGLLLARYRAIYQPRYAASDSTIEVILGSRSSTACLCLFDTPIRNYSLRQLRDTVKHPSSNLFIFIRFVFFH
jgi:hypothetical protein